MNDDSEDDFESTIALVIAGAVQATQNSERIRTSPLSGKMYVEELLTSGHPRRCFEVLRMSLETFFALRDWLVLHTSLKSSRKRAGISVEEKLVIFLHIVARGATNRDCCERFNCSTFTISRSIIIDSNLILKYKLIISVELFTRFLQLQ